VPLVIAVYLASRIVHPVARLARYSLLVIVLAALELFLATRALPYNSRATAPEALTDLRPAITALQATAQTQPSDRFLSISKIQFDPGDTAELKSIYGDQLSDKAFYDLIVATKAKEVVAPNLSMFYRVPSVDGYDGGVLPLRNYLTFQRLFLDPALIQTDGRLREQLKSIPAARWLNLMNARYVLTDKVGDQWYDGVLYDLQFMTLLKSDDSITTDQVPHFKANALGLVVAEPLTGVNPAEVALTFDDGSTLTRPVANMPRDSKEGLLAVRVKWDQSRFVKQVTVTGNGDLTLRGLALIDEASGTFQSFVLAPTGRFRVIYSGDVKVYENVDTLPRAFCVPTAHSVATDDEAVAYMQRAEFDPAREVVIKDQGSGIGDQAGSPDHLVIPARGTASDCQLVTYEPEHAMIDTNVAQDSYLIITDAYFPGWNATIDGQPATIERADLLFRAVKVPAGQHRIEMRYEPRSFAVGAVISIAAWLVLIGRAVFGFVRARRRVL